MDLNHVMMYVRDVGRALEFYAGRLGLTLIEGSPEMGYARLKMPAGSATLALHQAEETRNVAAEGIRLYFEIEDLDDVCARLEAQGVVFDQAPRDMPWGWRHAYLSDPDGHEISLYRAGDRRLRPTR
jgi:catechol 2,3-dioxygenase-like lactoylglutathione lyase family enzyme